MAEFIDFVAVSMADDGDQCRKLKVICVDADLGGRRIVISQR